MEDTNIVFDYDKCTKCGLCIRVCSQIRIGRDGENRPEKIIEMGCNDCGHCVAVCPEDAVENTNMDISDFKPMQAHDVSIDMFTNLVRNRRSIRKYKEQPLSKAHMDYLLKVANYIPTGSNKQALEYTIISSPERLQAIKAHMATKFRTLSKLMNSFLLKPFVSKDNREGMSNMIDLWEKGEDPFLRDAPCLIIIHTQSSYFGISQWDGGIAANTIDLAAQTIGVGTVMNGFFMTTSKIFGSLKKVAGLPKGHKVMAAISLGYPNIKYAKTVNRRPLKVNFDG